MTVLSTNDTMKVPVEHMDCGLTDWHGLLNNTIQIPWLGLGEMHS